MQSTSNVVASQKHFTTWGSHFIGQEEFNTDGVFHVSGPPLVKNSQYPIIVSILASSNRELPHPISETFALPPTTGCKYNYSNENRKKKLLIYFPIF
jgi:hypothetical protein